MLARLPPFEGVVPENQRREFGEHYRELAAAQKPVPPPPAIAAAFAPAGAEREEVVLLGSAGQRIITAGEILCLAGLHAGLNVTQKNDYDITVLRGPSISEMILSPEAIDYTGINRPSVVVAIGPEGVARRKKMFDGLDERCTIIQASGVEVPAGRASIQRVDFKGQGFKVTDWALASLGVLAKLDRAVRPEMLAAALAARLRGDSLAEALETVRRVEPTEAG